jgi:NADH-quinone oxidoreductase subunit J
LIALYTLITLAAAAAFAVLFVRTVLNAALSLIVCLLAISGIYVLLNAEFLAVVQILVYAGGILLLIIFGIMVTSRQHDIRPVSKLPGIAITIVLTSMLWLSVMTWVGEPVTASAQPESIGILLMTQYAAPFEIGGLLILISMIGAMITASTLKKSQ